MKKELFCLCFLLSCIGCVGQALTLEPISSGKHVKHSYFTIDYDATHKQAIWVYYLLTYDKVNGQATRGDNFRPDPSTPNGAQLSDYKGSGYDRGHLCPAADMKQSDEAMSETFFLSNMSPQAPEFNRGKWAQAERMVRELIKSDTDTLYVVTGPVFLNNQGAIGTNKITIPGYYFKAVYKPGVGMYALLMPNRKIVEPLYAWRVSVDLIEALAGIDLFPQLPQDIQDKMEAAILEW